MRPVLANIGLVLQLAGLLIIFPVLMGFIYGEAQAIIALFITGFAFFLSGFLFNSMSVREELDFRQSCVLLAAVFLILGVIGAVPFFWFNAFGDTGIAQRAANSFFESVSGYTTTGFSLISNPDFLPRSIIFYRSFTNLVGGLGVVFVLLAFFYNGKTLDNLTRVMNIVKVTDSIKKSLVSIIVIYAAYIGIFSLILYAIGFSNIADTISVVLSSLMTAGFSPTADFAKYAAFPAFWVILAMMIFGATSFFVHYKVISGKFHKAVTWELLGFLAIIAIGYLIVQVSYPIGAADAAFHVVSASTSTGFSTIALAEVPDRIKFLFIALMFIGGMGVSTAGGVKVFRVLLFLKSIPHEIGAAVGREYSEVRLDGTSYSRDEVSANFMFIILSAGLVLFMGSVLAFSGFGVMDSIFEAASAFGTVGLSVGIVSQALAIHLKLALAALMIIGRVEVIPFLAAISGIHAEDDDERNYMPVPV